MNEFEKKEEGINKLENIIEMKNDNIENKEKLILEQDIKNNQEKDNEEKKNNENEEKEKNKTQEYE